MKYFIKRLILYLKFLLFLMTCIINEILYFLNYYYKNIVYNIENYWNNLIKIAVRILLYEIKK